MLLGSIWKSANLLCMDYKKTTGNYIIYVLCYGYDWYGLKKKKTCRGCKRKEVWQKSNTVVWNLKE